MMSSHFTAKQYGSYTGKDLRMNLFSSDSSDSENSNAGENSGRWTAEEHRLFLQCLEKYGRKWKKFRSLIKSRTLVQIRTHAQKYFINRGKSKQVGDDSENACVSEGVSSSAAHGRGLTGRSFQAGDDAGSSSYDGKRRKNQLSGTKRKASNPDAPTSHLSDMTPTLVPSVNLTRASALQERKRSAMIPSSNPDAPTSHLSDMTPTLVPSVNLTRISSTTSEDTSSKTLYRKNKDKLSMFLTNGIMPPSNGAPEMYLPRTMHMPIARTMTGYIPHRSEEEQYSPSHFHPPSRFPPHDSYTLKNPYLSQRQYSMSLAKPYCERIERSTSEERLSSPSHFYPINRFPSMNTYASMDLHFNQRSMPHTDRVERLISEEGEYSPSHFHRINRFPSVNTYASTDLHFNQHPMSHTGRSKRLISEKGEYSPSNFHPFNRFPSIKPNTNTLMDIQRPIPRTDRVKRLILEKGEYSPSFHFHPPSCFPFHDPCTSKAQRIDQRQQPVITPVRRPLT